MLRQDHGARGAIALSGEVSRDESPPDLLEILAGQLEIRPETIVRIARTGFGAVVAVRNGIRGVLNGKAMHKNPELGARGVEGPHNGTGCHSANS